MIAPRDFGFHVFSLGLLPQEKSVLEKITSQLGLHLEAAKDELDLCRLTQNETSSICVIGQSDKIPEPSYITWLLKGIISSSKIMLIYNSITDEETQKLNRFDISNAMIRPIDPHRLARMIENVMTVHEEKREGFLTALTRFMPFRRHTLTH